LGIPSGSSRKRYFIGRVGPSLELSAPEIRSQPVFLEENTRLKNRIMKLESDLKDSEKVKSDLVLDLDTLKKNCDCLERDLLVKNQALFEVE